MRKPFVLTVIGVVFSLSVVGCNGCEPNPNHNPTTGPGTNPTTNPQPQPGYQIPDKLPKDAKLSVQKEVGNARWYVANFGGAFQYDPKQAQLKIEVDTEGWYKNGTLIMYDASGENPGATNTFDGTPSNPTVKVLEVPPEAIALNDHEKELVKAGSVIFVIRNDHGVGPGGTDRSSIP